MPKDEKYKWIDFWCDLNMQTLQRCKDTWLAVHPDHGIVASADSAMALDIRKTYLRRKLAAACESIDVATELDKRKSIFDPTKRAKPTPAALSPLSKETPASIPELKPVHVDPFDRPIEEPKFPVESLQAYAKRKGLKSTEVLMKLLSMGYPGIHVNAPLDEEMTAQLDSVFPEAKSPFPSPHKQPPFQPRKPDPFDRGAVIDGGGAAWRNRGIRFD